MGTNYYWEAAPDTEQIHIGKSSAGWCFSLHVYPENQIADLPDWQERWETGRIVDGSGNEIAPEKMLAIITARREPAKERPYGYKSWAEFHSENYSEWGPNNLLRSRIGWHCIGHGSGTWDLCIGEFC